MLGEVLADARWVLEIGSGTGQHAVFFARHLPHVTWQTSDLAAAHAGIRAWIREARLSNVMEPVTLDVDKVAWPRVGREAEVDAVFSANTAHIMPWPSVGRMIAGAARVLSPSGALVVYGPFSYRGHHTSPSNQRFDRDLRASDPQMGIRDVDALNVVGWEFGMRLVDDYAMPANNRILVWRRRRTPEPG